MPSPFPGMDPYLEDPALWSGFHHTFLSSLQWQLSPFLRPNYFVRVEERVYVTDEDDPAYRLVVPDIRVIEAARPRGGRVSTSGGPAIAEPIPVAEPLDPEIHEHRLEVFDRVDRAVVTVIELLSPTNKIAGSAGRKSFLSKRREVCETNAHWMEIDLLRGGARTADLPESAEAEYQAYLSRAGEPRRKYVWPIPLRQPLPVIGVPLRGNDPDVPLDLQAALSRSYEVGGYDMDLDYTTEPAQPLPPEAAAWAQAVVGDRQRS